jgi:hypothetical protein
MVSRWSIAASGMMPSTGAPQIGRNHDWPSTQTVHPGSSEEAKYKYGRRARSRQESHLKRRRFEDEDGDEGQADASDVGSDLRDRLADPLLTEIGIEPKSVPQYFSSVTQVLTIPTMLHNAALWSRPASTCQVHSGKYRRKSPWLFADSQRTVPDLLRLNGPRASGPTAGGRNRTRRRPRCRGYRPHVICFPSMWSVTYHLV